MSVFHVLTVLLLYTTLMGWITAIYNYRRKEHWKSKYFEMRDKRLHELKQTVLASAGAELVSRFADKMNL